MSTIKLKMTMLACMGLGVAAMAPVAQAATGDWLVRVGPVAVTPTSDETDLQTGGGLGVSGTYMVADHWGVELLAAAAKSDLKYAGSKYGDTAVVPLALSLQYHFLPEGRVRPYVGAGINHLMFTSENIEGCDCKITDSTGWAAQAGVDFAVGTNWMVNADVRYLASKVALSAGGVSSDKAKFNPVLVSVMFGWKFGGAK